MRSIYFIGLNSPSKLIDYQQHVSNLKEKVKVKLVTNDIESSGVFPNESLIIKYTSISNVLILNFVFSLLVISLLFRDKNKEVSIIYCYRFCASIFAVPLLIFRVFSKKKITLIYDMRSGSLNKKYYKLINSLFSFESLFYDKIFVVSKGLGSWLFPNRENVYVVPVGCMNIADNNKGDLPSNPFDDEIKFIVLYVGTFALRDLWSFYKDQSLEKSVGYIFVGDGDPDFQLKMINKFKNSNLLSNIHFTGRVDYLTANKYIRMADVCVSVVPVTPYYRFQPPTKILDYIAAKKPIITNNHEASIELLNGYENNYIISGKNYLFLGTSDLLKLLKNCNYNNCIKHDYSWINISKSVLDFAFD